MTKTLKSIAPLQFGKVFGAVYALISLIFAPFFILFSLISFMVPQEHGNQLSPLFGVGLGIIMAIAFPIIYGIMGFVFGALGAFVYNLISKWIGGIQVEVE